MPAVVSTTFWVREQRRRHALVQWGKMLLAVVLGLLLGVGLAFITLRIVGNAYVTKVNGWTTMFGCGEPGDGLLLRAACSETFVGPINVPEEAMYWTTSVDGAGQKL